MTTDSEALSDRRFGWSLLVITGIGLTIRALQVILVTGRKALTSDAFYYHSQAQLITQGHWFVQPFSMVNYGASIPGVDHPPGFVLLLAGLDVVGMESPLAQRWVMTLLGSATVVVIGITLRRVIGPRAGLIGASIAAIYPNIWFNDGRLMSETLFVFMFTVALYAVYRFRDTRQWPWLILLSTSLSVAASARPEAVLLFAFILVPAVIAATHDRPHRRLAMLGVGLMIPLAVFTPWVVFNSLRFDRLVVMSTGGGQTLLQGNCKLSYYGSGIGLNRFECLDQVPVTGNRNLNLAELDGRYQNQAIENIRKHLRRQPKVVIVREARTWGLWRPRQQRVIDQTIEHRGSSSVVHVQQWSWWILGSLSLPGIFLWRRHRFGLYPLGAQIALTVLATGITFGSTRYRSGAEVCAVFLAAATIDFAWRRWSRWRRRSTTATKQPQAQESRPETHSGSSASIAST